MADWLSKFVEDIFPSKETLRAKSVTLSEAAALLELIDGEQFSDLLRQYRIQ